MANQWFRLYSEFSTDPKVQMLSEQDQRRLVMLFCMRCNVSEALQDKHVTFHLRISVDEWVKTKANFVDAGFIDLDNKVLNWDKRQYVSDSSTTRVTKYRDKMKRYNETKGNVTVTPPEQNRTEQKQSKPLSEYSDEFEQFWNAYPKKTGKGGAYTSWKKQKPKLADVLTALSWQTIQPDWVKENGQFVPMPATYLNQRRWEDECKTPKLDQAMQCPKGFPFSEWMKASQQEKQDICRRNNG